MESSKLEPPKVRIKKYCKKGEERKRIKESGEK